MKLELKIFNAKYFKIYLILTFMFNFMLNVSFLILLKIQNQNI